MRPLSKALVLALVVVGVLRAQSVAPSVRLYATYSEATPSGAAYVVTVQQPATAPRQITFEGATIYCSVACNPTLEINGGVATTTVGTALKLDSRAPAAASAVFTASNSTAGTVISKYTLAVGQTLDIVKSGLTLGATAAARQNLTIRTDAISGTVHILLMWSEPQ
jgi:hypothetical protein